MDERNDALFKKVAVLGAAGKMGRGISLLLLQEMARVRLKDKTPFSLNLVDTDEKSFLGLKHYLKEQIIRFAEKNINLLRSAAKEQKELVSNEEIIEGFVEESILQVNCSTAPAHAKGAELIFEAVLESVPLKVDLFKEVATEGCYIFSNTSSIPIEVLAKESHQEKNLIGFHFYNPPPVQKLMEIIPSKYTEKKLVDFSLELAERLGKFPIFSSDVAGFIGNGHFFREIVFAFELVEELSKGMKQEEAIAIVNRATKDPLLRPMGIFQLLDYVGLPIVKHVMEVMQNYLKDPHLKAPLAEAWLAAGLIGGQTFEGKQKEGIFQYEKGLPVAVYSLKEKKYLPLPDEKGEKVTWKTLQKEKNLQDAIKTHFEELKKDPRLEAKLAIRYLKHSQEIVEGLVRDGVAKSTNDVGEVLKKGFYHLYNPVDVIIKI